MRLITPINVLKTLVTLLLLSYMQICPAQSDKTPVRIAKVKAFQIHNTIQISGTLLASKSSHLGAEVEGTVNKRFVEIGDIVKKNQIMLQIRDTQTRLSLEAARALHMRSQASVELAQIDEHRLANLLKSHSTSTESYDAAKARLAQRKAEVSATQAEVAQLEDLLDRHKLSAPFDSVVISRLVEIGDWVESGDGLFQIASIDIVKVALPIPQNYYSQIKVGNPVFIIQKNNKIKTKISRIIPNADTSTRTFMVWAVLDNHNRHFIPGMSVKAVIHLDGPLANTLSVPRDALIRNANGEVSLWRIKNDDSNEVEQLQVIEGEAAEGWIAVRNDQLKANDKIVVRGNETLRSGQQIIIQ